MNENLRIEAVVALSGAFSKVRDSGDGVLADKIGKEIERQLRILNPWTAPSVALTDADALADLNGEPRPDNPSR